MVTYTHIDILFSNDQDTFKEKYLDQKPVLIKGYFKKSEAVKNWNEEFFLNKVGKTNIKVNLGGKGKYQKHLMKFSEYIEWLIQDQNKDTGKISDGKESYYLHNFSLEKAGGNLFEDLNFYPETFVGDWYLSRWKRNLFMFYGNKNSLTPLHFDALGTHNTFLQVKGHKKFILILAEQVKYCYMETDNITLSKVDPLNPDYQKYPLFKNATPYEALLEGGDLLYMPPYTLHHVLGLDLNISLNIDWHTPKSVLETFYSGKVKSLRCHYWNSIFFLGIYCGVPNALLYPLYKSHYY